MIMEEMTYYSDECPSIKFKTREAARRNEVELKVLDLFDRDFPRHSQRPERLEVVEWILANCDKIMMIAGWKPQEPCRDLPDTTAEEFKYLWYRSVE